MISLGAIESLTQDHRRENQDSFVELQKHGINTWMQSQELSRTLLTLVIRDPPTKTDWSPNQKNLGTAGTTEI